MSLWMLPCNHKYMHIHQVARTPLDGTASDGPQRAAHSVREDHCVAGPHLAPDLADVRVTVEHERRDAWNDAAGDVRGRVICRRGHEGLQRRRAGWRVDVLEGPGERVEQNAATRRRPELRRDVPEQHRRVGTDGRLLVYLHSTARASIRARERPGGHPPGTRARAAHTRSGTAITPRSHSTHSAPGAWRGA